MSRLVVVKQALGLASIVMGVAALMAPRRFASAIGVADVEPEAVVAFGSRELASGAALLAPVRFGPFLWLRVAGDAMDLAGLGWAASKPGSNKRLLGLASLAVVCMAAFDLAMALDSGEDDDEVARHGKPAPAIS